MRNRSYKIEWMIESDGFECFQFSKNFKRGTDEEFLYFYVANTRQKIDTYIYTERQINQP